MASKKAKGKRAKTRHSHKRKASRISVNKLLKEFKTGSAVQITINPSVHSGMPFRRYQGISGSVIGVQGRAVKVAVREGNAKRLLIVHPAHLKELKGESSGDNKKLEESVETDKSSKKLSEVAIAVSE